MSEIKLIQAIVKASQIIDCFSEDNRNLSLRDICNMTGFSKSTAYGLIRTLEQMNYLIQNQETKSYRLGLKFVTKGYYAANSLDILDIAIPSLKNLNEKHNEATTFFLLEKDSLRCVYSLGSSGQVTSMRTQLGAELEMFGTASGRAVLACFSLEKRDEYLSTEEFKSYISRKGITEDEYICQLETISKNGYSDIDDMERIGFAAVSCVIKNSRGPIGTISITGPQILIEQKKDAIIDDLISICEKISTILG